MAAIESPCRKVCILDPARSHCLGCARTLAEIAQWTRLNDHERRAVMALLPARLAALAAPAVAPCERV